MNSYYERAVHLRKKGYTYSEIMAAIPGVKKSTLSYWLSPLKLSENQKNKLTLNIFKKLNKARAKALVRRRENRQQYFLKIEYKNQNLISVLNGNKGAAKLVLSALHLGEGSKYRRGSIQFGNSDPGIIKLFMRLMRDCYAVNESKFRCTVLCRADQDPNSLERFWRNITGISRGKFYKTRIDKRTIGKPSKKPDYKGVCVINYLSADVYYDLLTIGKMMIR